MKKNKLLFFILIVTLFVIFSCSEDSTSSDTEAPTVAITYPVNNSEFVQGTVITITADATDNKGVKEVEFYIDGDLASLDDEEPYEYEWDTGETRDTDHTIYAIAYDTNDNTKTSEVINITLTEFIGSPPNPPSNPNPEDNATSVSTNVILSWDCSDPENDPLTYDVYFGTSSNPSLVNSGQSNTTYDPGTLNEETTYYWQIKAHDDHSNSTTGDIWKFTTYGGGSGGDFEWCDVPAGDYTYGEASVTQNIDYDFQIMKYEVTNQQYVDFLEEALNTGNITVTTSSVEGYYEGDDNYSAGTYEFLDLEVNSSRIQWNGNNFTIYSGFEDHPVVKVTWFGSWAFAEYYGFRLPSEQEWEKAARSNTGYDYPWGDSIDGSRANYSLSGDPWDNGTTPVGIYNGQTIQGFSTTDSPSPFGVYDLAGNVWEWSDSWSSDTSSYRVVRGGSYSNISSSLRSWSRSYDYPTYSSSTFGFRCVFP